MYNAYNCTHITLCICGELYACVYMYVYHLHHVLYRAVLLWVTSYSPAPVQAVVAYKGQ